MKNNENKSDLRIIRTQKFLFDALLALINEKGFENISVTEICEKAMVHRTTFYKHYEDKYHLFYEGSKTYLSEYLSQSVYTDFINISEGEIEVSPHLVSFFHHAVEHKEFYKLLVNVKHIAIFNRILTESFRDRFHNQLQSYSMQNKEEKLRLSLITHFFSGAMVNTLSWWLEKDMPFTPEDMAKHITELVGYGILHTLYAKEL